MFIYVRMPVQLDTKMYRVEVHKHIKRITEVFYRMSIWHRGDEETVAEWRLKLWKSVYSIYYFLFLVSLMSGVVATENSDEFVFLVQIVIMAFVFLAKLLYLIWRKREILEQLNCVCNYDVEDRQKLNEINEKFNILMKFVAFFFSLTYLSGICIVLIAPFLGAERTLFFKIGFPLDWKNDEIAYWTAFMFTFTEVNISLTASLFSAIIWYLMANCGLRYVALGRQIKVMGEIKLVDETAIGIKISYAQRDNLYQRDLIEAITSHQHLEELTNQLNSFLNNVFAVKLATSAFCICSSIYCLAFNQGGNWIELLIYLIILLYNIFDIFMVMYFGNEIQLASDRLSYCLFESNWVERSQSIKKNVLIFGEFLMKPHKMVVLKIYQLNLETFMRILNSAYSMFNVLQNFK